MNTRITLTKMAQLLADKHGRNKKDYEDILKAFFLQIASALEAGDSVRVKGFGSFKLSRVQTRKSVDVSSGEDTEIPAHSRIVFVPAKDFASAVNAPFEMFETIELEENLLEDELAEAEAEGNEFQVQTAQSEMIIEEEKMDELKSEYPAEFDKPHDADSSDKNETPQDGDSYDETVPSDETETPAESEPEESEISQESNSSEEKKEERNAPIEIAPSGEYHKHSFGHGFLFGCLTSVAIVLLTVVALWIFNDDFADFCNSKLRHSGKVSTEQLAKLEPAPESAENEIPMAEAETETKEDVAEEVSQEVTQPAAESSNDEVPTQPSDAPEYDTITKTRYLGTMAKQHYGNYHLWPYIYKENEKILGHPDRIRPGTRVVIPKLSKYGVDAKNPKDIERAKRLGVEIYSRYNR